MSAKPMTKKEWNEYLAKTWEEAVESTYQDMIDEAVKAEREACANICEEEQGYKTAFCALKIRARGQE